MTDQLLTKEDVYHFIKSRGFVTIEEIARASGRCMHESRNTRRLGRNWVLTKVRKINHPTKLIYTIYDRYQFMVIGFEYIGDKKDTLTFEEIENGEE